MINLSSQVLNKRLFVYAIGLICLTYGIFEYYFIADSILTADEFAFIQHILHYHPTETTLGHYLISLPLWFYHEPIKGLLLLKNEIAVFNMVLLMISCYWAMTIFKPQSVVIALLAILSNQHYLLHTADLNPDMLAGWVSLLAFISILRQSPRLAGILLGVALLISPKAICYIAASNLSLIVCWLAFSTTFFSMAMLLRLNIYLITTVLLYLGICSCLVNPSSVFSGFFANTYLQTTISTVTLQTLWNLILTRGPFLFLLWPIATVCLLIPTINQSKQQQQVFVAALATTSLLLFIDYQQTTHDNFILILPAFFILYAEFFTWLFSSHTNPLFLTEYPRVKQIGCISIATTFILTVIIIPIYKDTRIHSQFDGSYQHINITLGNELLKDGSHYLAGLPLIYTQPQPAVNMQNANELIQTCKQHPIKFIINNERLVGLPMPALQFLHDNYRHYYGSIYLYAPKVANGIRQVNLAFSAYYRIDGKKNAFVNMDGKIQKVGSYINLAAGKHLSSSLTPYRLVLVPKKTSLQLSKRHYTDQWQNMVNHTLL